MSNNDLSNEAFRQYHERLDRMYAQFHKDSDRAEKQAKWVIITALVLLAVLFFAKLSELRQLQAQPDFVLQIECLKSQSGQVCQNAGTWPDDRSFSDLRLKEEPSLVSFTCKTWPNLKEAKPQCTEATPYVHESSSSGLPYNPVRAATRSNSRRSMYW